jgi:hypothetical protein
VELLPIPSPDAHSRLLDGRLVKGDFSPRSIETAARIFRRPVPFVETNGFLLPPGNWPPSQVVTTIALRLVEHWGATTVSEVESQLSENGFDVERRLLEMYLLTLDGFAWLDQENEWFWAKSSRNRLLNQIEKIVSVAGSIELSELRAGVGRHHRTKGFRPPREVLASLCQNSGAYSRVGDMIVGGPDLRDWRIVLAANERKLAQTLFDYGPVMRRDDLERVVVTERGLNRSSFYVYLTYSPILERFAPGVFGLRGAKITAAEVQAMIPPHVRHQVLLDHGWTNDGLLWVAFHVSPAAAQTGIFGTPAAIGAVAKGSYQLSSEDNHPVGTLVIEQAIWGLSPYFRRWGVESGDYVVIALNLDTKQASIATGSEELLLKYQSGE